MLDITGGYDVNISYELYRIFYAVAKNGNITKAAGELMISQPAISKSIKNLEEQLGGELFTRTQKGVVLTKEGEEFYKYIEQAILYIDNAENKFSSLISLDTGKINIGISTTRLVSCFLMEHLADFHKLYPKIKIEVMVGETAFLISQLRNGLLDVLVLMSTFDECKDLNVIKCKKGDVCFIINNDYPELLGKKVSLEEISKYPLILPVRDFNDRILIDDYALANNIHFNPSLELSSYGLIRDFTLAGFGIGVIPELAIEEDIKAKRVYKIDVVPKSPNFYIGIVGLKKREASFSTQKLIDIITYKNKI